MVLNRVLDFANMDLYRKDPCAPLPPALGGDATCAGSCAPADPAGAGAGSSAGSAGGGSAGVWGFLGVQDSARALGAVTSLAPAMPSTP